MSICSVPFYYMMIICFIQGTRVEVEVVTLLVWY